MKYKIFIGIFFLISVLPLVVMLVPGQNRELANEVLAEPPSLIIDGEVNVHYPSEFSDFFDDHFGLRRQMIGLQNRLVAAVFGESAEQKVILGKDGWLFYEETLDDYQGTNAFSEQEINGICTALSLMEEYCRTNGMKFVFTIAPNKNSLYGEMMPGYYLRNRENANGEVLSRELPRRGISYVNLFDAFRREEKRLYRKSDSHWTQEGAGLAADQILQALSMGAEPFYGSATRVEKAPAGDLYEMLYLSDRDTDMDVLYERPSTFAYVRPIRSVEDNFIRTRASEGQGKLFMFRDSFGNNLHMLMAEAFADATFCRLNPYNLSLAAAENADVVVVEIVERNLEWLLTKPPVFPAPLREFDGRNLEDVTQRIQVTAENTEELPGYCKVQGELPVDIRGKRICLKTNGKIYEATPSAFGFVGYLPADEGEPVSVMIMEKE